jgi:hypothetical protein
MMFLPSIGARKPLGTKAGLLRNFTGAEQSLPFRPLACARYWPKADMLRIVYFGGSFR